MGTRTSSPARKSVDQKVADAMRWRYAVKKFDPTRKIPQRQWRALEHSLVLAPSSYGLQPWRFLVVDDPAKRELLVAAAWNQRQIADASHLVVFTTLGEMSEEHVDRYMRRIADVRGTSLESLAPFKKSILDSVSEAPSAQHVREWNTRQLYIALGTFMTVAAVMGIDTCPIEGLEPPKFDKILGLDETPYSTVVACPAGYRAADDKYAAIPKVRFPLEEVVRHI